MPVEHAIDVAGYLRKAELDKPDDHALAEYIEDREMAPPLITVPNLVTHGELSSLIGNDRSLGARGTALPANRETPPTWWSRPPLSPEWGAPVMSYYLASMPFRLREPGVFGYDVSSLRFPRGEEESLDRAITAAGISLQGSLARSFRRICLAYVAASEFAYGQCIEEADAQFRDGLCRVALATLIPGMLRSFTPSISAELANQMTIFVQSLLKTHSPVDNQRRTTA